MSRGWLCRRHALVATVVLAVLAAGLVASGTVGASDDGLLAGPFPEEIHAQGQTIHTQIVEYRADKDDTLVRDSWIESPTGNFLVLEQRNSQVAFAAALDGNSFRAYDVVSHRAWNLSREKIMSIEPDAITSRRDLLDSLAESTNALIERSGVAGVPAKVSGRSARRYDDVGKSTDGAHKDEVWRLDLVVDEGTGLPLQKVVREADKDLVSRRDYDYEVTSDPNGGFTVKIPNNYHIQTDSELASPAERNLSIPELAQTAEHPVYWAGDSFGGRTITASMISGTGVVNLKYGEATSSSGKTAGSPEISLYEFVPSALDSKTLQSITGALGNPKEISGKRGSYTLYEADLNGMPMLEVVRGDVHILIADDMSGDIALMTSVAGSLMEVTK